MNIYVLLLLYSLNILFCAPCTENDFGISYGPCTNSRRDVVFYLKNDCEQTTLKLPNPPILERQSCGGICTTRYDIYNISKNCTGNVTACCTACKAGYEPDSGEYLLSEWDRNKPLPSNFYSTTWKQDDVGLTTGPVPPNSTSTLEIEIDILNTNINEILVQYIAYSTGSGSYFQILLDGEPFPNDNDSFARMGNWDFFYLLNLPYGTHTVSLVYHSNNENITSLVEGARISYIVFYGIQHDSTVCVPCAPGRGGSGTRCGYCSVNHYTNTSGQGACEACPPDHYSLAGATTCAPKIPCTLDDYRISYSKCENNTVTKTYYQYYPYICDNTTLPQGLVNNSKVECPRCNPGLYFVNDTCVACPPGTYREKIDDDESACKVCPNGTIALKSLYFKTIDFAQKEYFTTYCDALLITYADCDSGGDGWNSYNNTITSGNYYLGAVSTRLVAHIEGSYGSTIEFRFRTHLERDSYFVYYSGVNGLPTIYNSSSNNVGWITVTLPYSQANFTWHFNKYQKRAYNNVTGQRVSDYVEIDYIVFHDVVNATGGGTTCHACPAGTVSQEGATTCHWCPPGTYSHSGDPNCTPCSNNTYSNAERSEDCLPCGEQSHADHVHNDDDDHDHDGNELNTTCSITSCGFTLNSTHVFDLSPIVLNPPEPGSGGEGEGEGEGQPSNDTMYGPIEIPEYIVGAFYIGVCDSRNSEVYCKGGDYAINTKFCEVWGANNVYDVGNKTNITFFENFDTGEYGINITYYDGTYYFFWYEQNLTGPRSAEVLFVCKPGAGVGKLQKNKTIDFITPPHRYHFRWETDYACRLCQPEDYEPFVTECFASSQTTRYVLKNGVKCSQGAVAPPETTSSCTMPAVTFNAGPLVIIIVVAVAVAIAVVVILVILIRRNRKLTYQLAQKDLLSKGGVTSGAGGAEKMVSFGNNK